MEQRIQISEAEPKALEGMFALEKYPEQLYEVTRDEYLKAKHHELLDTEKLQLDVDAS